MYKIASPRSKTSLLPPKDPPISEDPNIPCCCEHHFKEKRVAKTGSRTGNTLLGIRPLGPVNLKVIPHSGAEIALEEQVRSVLMDISITYNTKIILSLGPPVSSNQHVFGVESIKEQ